MSTDIERFYPGSDFGDLVTNYADTKKKIYDAADRAREWGYKFFRAFDKRFPTGEYPYKNLSVEKLIPGSRLDSPDIPRFLRDALGIEHNRMLRVVIKRNQYDFPTVLFFSAKGEQLFDFHFHLNPTDQRIQTVTLLDYSQFREENQQTISAINREFSPAVIVGALVLDAIQDDLLNPKTEIATGNIFRRLLGGR